MNINTSNVSGGGVMHRPRNTVKPRQTNAEKKTSAHARADHKLKLETVTKLRDRWDTLSTWVSDVSVNRNKKKNDRDIGNGILITLQMHYEYV